MKMSRYLVLIVVISSVMSTVSSQTSCSNFGIYFEEVEKSCVNYTRCIFGFRSEHSCGDGFQFDPKTSRCDLSSVVKCNKCPASVGFGDLLAYRDTTNCSIGFVCSGETYPFQINCSDSLHFDVDTLMCIVPEYPDCNTKVTTTEVPSTTTRTRPTPPLVITNRPTPPLAITKRPTTPLAITKRPTPPLAIKNRPTPQLAVTVRPTSPPNTTT